MFRAIRDETFMRLALEQAEIARGGTGNNPWVGCLIVAENGSVLGRGYTRGPGEHHAEISAAEDAAARGHGIVGATLYSTLEPCSFHGRTPACAHAIIGRGLRRVVVALRDPHPQVDGVGLRILREGGLEVIEGVCEDEVRRQLAPWILAQHPHEISRHAATQTSRSTRAVRLSELAERYGLPAALLERFVG
jgi:diaminohydroxyphosphoribosylaminopyrimidine deaminase/5-amino-6-(5-phosphoribosylamino)uracil reductase